MDLALPLLTVITSIDYDHTEYLGNTLKKIAYEKAGIMKTGCTCIIADQKKEVICNAKYVNSQEAERGHLAHLSTHPLTQLQSKSQEQPAFRSGIITFFCGLSIFATSAINFTRMGLVFRFLAKHFLIFHLFFLQIDYVILKTFHPLGYSHQHVDDHHL